MTAHTAPPLETLLEPLTTGWLRVVPPAPLEIGGSVRGWRVAVAGGVLVVLCEAGVPGPLPGRRQRARLRRRIEERAGDVILVFTDAIQAAAIWSLPPAGGASGPAEYHLPGRERGLDAALRSLLEHRTRERLSTEGESLLVRTLATRLACDGALTIAELAAHLGARATTGELRRAWRSLLRLRVLDEDCGTGHGLGMVGEALLPLHCTALHRLRAAVDDLADLDGSPADPLASVRPLLRTLEQESGCVERFCRQLLCRRTLFGIARSAAEARVARITLRRFARLAKEEVTPFDLNVRVARSRCRPVLPDEAPWEEEGWVLERARVLLETYRIERPRLDPEFRRAAIGLERRERRWIGRHNAADRASTTWPLPQDGTLLLRGKDFRAGVAG